MCMFKARVKSGHLALLASCVVLPPAAEDAGAARRQLSSSAHVMPARWWFVNVTSSENGTRRLGSRGTTRS